MTQHGILSTGGDMRISLGDNIESWDQILGGTPVIKGSRLTVYTITARIEGGGSREQLVADYPYLSTAIIDAAIDYARANPHRPEPVRPWRACAR